MARKPVSPRSHDEMIKNYPIESTVTGWFFRCTEVSSNVYLVEGCDNWGRKVSRTGTDEKALISRCEDDARAINGQVTRPMTCSNCETFDTRLEIRLPGELARILAKLKRAVAAGELKYNGFESSRALIGQPDFGTVEPSGPYPDALDYYFDCPSCGAVFELTAETYHGSGGKWVRLR